MADGKDDRNRFSRTDFKLGPGVGQCYDLKDSSGKMDQPFDPRTLFHRNMQADTQR